MRLARVCAARAVCVLCVSAVGASGCTSMHSVNVTATAPYASDRTVRPGDDVRITMRDGRRVRLTVRTVDAASITGQGGERYDLPDILTVERRGFNAMRTTFLVVGIAGGVLLVSVGAAIASLAGSI